MIDCKHARHMDKIQPFRVMALLAEAKQLEASGRSIIHMEVGEPDFDTPQPIIEAGIQALKEGRTHYTAAVGDMALRQSISDYYRQQFNIDIAAERILVTPGASGALQLVLSVLINPADQVVMADPGYPCNRNFIYLLGGEPVAVEVSSQTHFQIQAQHLPAVWSEKCRALLLASPSNPTGTIIEKNEMKAIIDYVHSRNAVVIVDEIYQGLCYEHEAYSALQLSKDIFVINSFSKYFGMTGWRLGWIVAPECYVGDLDKLAQNLYLAASTPAQVAAISAFSADTRQILEERTAIYRQRRDYLLPELEKLGFRIPVVPDGAFYIYADCSQLTDDSLHFCQQALHQAGVAITPGLDFGDNHPQDYIRFAYTTDMAGLKEGIRRLREFIQDYTSARNTS
jgi:aspartate/methionine/tyrosine aminotransferase